MFPNSCAVCLVGSQHLWERLAETAYRRLGASARGRLGAFTHESRGATGSKAEERAAFGVDWTADLAHERVLAVEVRTDLTRRTAAPSRYPTLAAIDLALDDRRPRFTAAANAADLERRARELTNQYWSDSAWVTGHVPAAAFERVCTALESEWIAAGVTASPPTIADLAGTSAIPAT